MHAPSSALAFTRSLHRSSPLVKLAAVVIGSAFIAASAQITVPMIPVPMTMQTFAVLAVGALYGSRLGVATMVAYLAEGAAGLPVFHGGTGGLPVFAGPTAGYLLGFVVAAGLVGWLADRGATARPLGALLSTLLGMATIYLFGLPWLAAMIGWEKAVTLGAVPFLLGDALKALLAALTATGIGRVAFGGGHR